MKSKLSITLLLRLAILGLLIYWSFSIVKPFVGVLAWAVILAVAIEPFYQKLVKKAGTKRKKMVTTLFAIVSVAILVIPTYSIFSSVLESSTETVKSLKDGTFEIMPPSEKVKDLPLGERIYADWKKASEDIQTYAMEHKDFLMEKGKGLMNSFTGIMGTMVAFILSLIIAIIFMHNSENGYKSTINLANKLVGKKDSEEIVMMSRNTIRSVVKGILLVAIIQALLSFIGFKIFDIPAAGIFAFLVLFSAIIQVPVTIAVIPTIIIAFSMSDNTTSAIIFTIYIVAVSLLDNFLKPILLSKGLKTPTVVIFLGAIGGVLLHGIIGLFVGTVVLALTYQFYVQWLNSEEEE